MGYPDFEAIRAEESARARGYEQGSAEYEAQIKKLEEQLKAALSGHRPQHEISDAKRFRLPSVVVANCPVCGVEVRRNFDEHPMSYPEANKPLTLHLEHEAPTATDGYHEFDVMIELRVELIAIADCRIEAP